MVIKMTEVEFYKLKAELKNERAQFALAECFENGEGIEKNIKEALFWYKKSAENGFAPAQCRLADRHYDVGNINLAIKWYRKAAEQNDGEAQYKLARIYIEQNDIDNAMKWYQSSAKLGNFYAQVAIVRLYLDFGDEKRARLIAEQYEIHWSAITRCPCSSGFPVSNKKEKLNILNHIKGIQEVQFSAVTPRNFIDGEHAIINLIIYQEEFYEILDEIIENGQSEFKKNHGGFFQIRKKTKVGLRLFSKEISYEEKYERIWNGGFINFTFDVLIPENNKLRTISFGAEVYLNDVPAANLFFVVECVLNTEPPKIIRRDILSAFVSYARENQKEVLRIIQGIKKARPDMDIFFDQETLHSGENWSTTLCREIENRDLFYLFWSVAAKNSEWVEKEWRYALEKKGIDSIEPVPLEPPTKCSPPIELSSKHFDDKWLRFM